MRKISFMFFVLLAITLTACNLNIAQPAIGSPSVDPTELAFPTDLPAGSSPADVNSSSPATQIPLNQTILDLSSQVVQDLANKDFLSLAAYVHPEVGVRFSPYSSVKDTDQVFSKDEIANILADSRTFTWGAYSGSGEPVNLSFPEYYSKFIYDQDFANAPEMSLNHRLSTGNSIDNIAVYYPGAMVVEYYFPGFDPQYGGMDWRSLRQVFTEYQGSWYLAGIIHDEWTP